MNTSWARKEAAGAQLAPESCCKTQYSAVDNCTTNSTMLHHTVSHCLHGANSHLPLSSLSSPHPSSLRDV